MKTALVVGGDLRQNYLSLLLCSNFKVYTLCLSSEVASELNITETTDIGLVDFIFLPIPCMTGGKINTPFGWQLSIEQMLRYANKKTIIIGGYAGESLKDMISLRNINYYDYTDFEEFYVENTKISAEGAVMVAMSSTKFCVDGSKCVIYGYGRLGKELAKKMQANGSYVSIVSFKEEERNEAAKEGLNIYKLKNLESFDIIFNTIPAQVIENDVINTISENAVIIELASKPWGFDYQYAISRQKNAIMAGSLPGKTAPLTSARLLYKIFTENIYGRLQNDN